MYSESLNMNIDDDKKCAHCALGNSGRPDRTYQIYQAGSVSRSVWSGIFLKYQTGLF